MAYHKRQKVTNNSSGNKYAIIPLVKSKGYNKSIVRVNVLDLFEGYGNSGSLAPLAERRA